MDFEPPDSPWSISTNGSSTAAKVLEHGGDYVLALRANQATLHDDIRLYPMIEAGARA